MAIIPQKVIDNIDVEINYEAAALKYDCSNESCNGSVNSGATAADSLKN